MVKTLTKDNRVSFRQQTTKKGNIIRTLEKELKHYKTLYKIQKEHSGKLSKLLDEAIEMMKSWNK